MIVIDEYMAVRVLGGAWPDDLPDDELALPANRHWQLLQRVHGPSSGQLSRLLARPPCPPTLSTHLEGLGVVRFPHPEILLVESVSSLPGLMSSPRGDLNP